MSVFVQFERQMYIISKLTVKDYISVEEFEDKLYVFVSTINKDIISVTEWLKENLNLDIKYVLSNRIELNVTEKEKRNIISWILSYKLNASTLTKQFGYNLTGHSLQLFCIEIIVAIRRIELGYKLENNDEINDELKPIIIALREKIESNKKVTLSKVEWLNLQQYFISKQFISGTSIKMLKQRKQAVLLMNSC